MKTGPRPYQTEDDYWRIRNFLREVLLLNDRREHSWHVARLDYWRWHLILNCQVCDPVEKVTTLWETAGGQIAAVLHPVGWGEIRLHVHPQFRTADLEGEMLAHAEEHLSDRNQAGKRFVYVPVFSDDTQRQQVLAQRGYTKSKGLRRLQKMGCTRVFANAYDPPADRLYQSVLGTKEASETWFKEY